jgi:hypothetical protein
MAGKLHLLSDLEGILDSVNQPITQSRVGAALTHLVK